MDGGNIDAAFSDRARAALEALDCRIEADLGFPRKCLQLAGRCMRIPGDGEECFDQRAGMPRQ